MLAELQQDIALLREEMGHLYDSARFRFIESMSERAADLRAPAQEILQTKIADALARYRIDQEAKAQRIATSLAELGESDRALAEALLNNGDEFAFKKLLLTHQNNTRPSDKAIAKVMALRELLDEKPVSSDASASALERQLREQERQSLSGAAYTADIALSQGDAEPMPDQRPLQASQKMQVFQQRSAIAKRVEIAIQQGPESPGPLNPQMLALKALTAMRDLSPQYLHRYVNYLDALFWIDHVTERPEPTKPAKKTRKTTRKK
ncbi:DUF2894 domain-containing protein [Zhongshania aquimaris]|uniref:DUF2894 domain-containing protein n=1 Tax=Zhongshania aquimaris TaxID=2857107 RepID=A0ABS6VUZ0_9GAMM|nr:DUF2894 domain-containing protein [Zhongshania aquimaris]MBW2942148.1 DUF2894 domain-containing protein [Zhongshania aquimaris]